jgi:flagellin
MGLRINTNVASLTAQRNMFNVTEKLQGNFARLASGQRIATASDDAAGLAISERMRSQIRSYSVASRNAQDGLSLAQTAEGAMEELSNIVSRMRELAMQAANGTYSQEDRDVLEEEFVALYTEIDRVAQDAEFNGNNLLDGTFPNVDIQVGIEAGEVITLQMADLQAANLGGGAGIDSLTIATMASASTALDELDNAITTINTTRGNVGAQSNRLNSAMRSILNARENLSASESRIRDVDVAEETANLTKNSIMQQAAVTVLAQANSQPQVALSLLQ